MAGYPRRTAFLMRFLVLPVSQQARNTWLAFFMTFKYIYLLMPTRTRCVLGQEKRVAKAMEKSFKMVQVNFGVRSDHLLFYASLNTAFWNCQVLEVFLRYFFFFLEIHISKIPFLKSHLADSAECRTLMKRGKFSICFKHIIILCTPYILH